MYKVADARESIPNIDKFQDPEFTATGEPRAAVAPTGLHTLWFNTGTLCNLACQNCYIESSPRNDRLAYISAHDTASFLDEIESEGTGTRQIGFTGGEPFMNPEFMAMLEDCLGRGFEVLVLTNAMRPMMKQQTLLLGLRDRFRSALTIRVSLDHYSKALHELERGPRSWQPTLDGLQWLSDQGFKISVAGRTHWGEPEMRLRLGYAQLFAEKKTAIDAFNTASLVLFPEIDAQRDVAEISEGCWRKLGVDPGSIMCASSRMVVKRKGDTRCVVTPCTLLPYEKEFEMGRHLVDSLRPVKLNHPNCARFCVLGGGSCSSK